MNNDNVVQSEQNQLSTRKKIVSSHNYPPDMYFDKLASVSFIQFIIIFTIIIGVIEIFRVGFAETPIPYNYPLYGGCVYVIIAAVMTRKFHSVFDNQKKELADILRRTTADNAVFDRESDITPEEFADDFDSILNWAFHPMFILIGGIVVGMFTLLVMWSLNVFDTYPYIILSYTYGAAHGFYLGPIAGAVYIIYKIPNDYIVDIDLLAPDGVGGYREIGDAIVLAVIYWIFIFTLDFILLSSATFVGKPLFTTAVFSLHGLLISFILCLTVVGVVAIRRQLLDIRDRKSDMMREQFQDIESRYWKKLKDGEQPSPEAEHIETMDTMFNRLHSMELWPINLASLSRLAFSVGSSGAIAAYKAGLIPIPL